MTRPMDKMVEAITRKTPQTSLPTAPLVLSFAAALKGYSSAQFVSDSVLMSDCLLTAQERFGYDVVYAFAGAGLEAEAAGTALDFDVEGYPAIRSYCPVPPSAIPDLVLPDPGYSGRMPLLLDAIGRMKNRLGDQVPVVALATGPLTIAHHLMPIEDLLYLSVDDPNLFADIIGYCTRITAGMMIAMAEAGASGVILADFATSSYVTPSWLFEKVLIPKHLDIVRNVRSSSKVLIGAHIPDADMRRLSLIADLQPDWIDADENVDPIEVRSTYHNAALIGNLRPYLFVKGSREDINSASARVIETAHKYGGAVLGSASEVPYDSNPENIEELVRIAQSYHHAA